MARSTTALVSEYDKTRFQWQLFAYSVLGVGMLIFIAILIWLFFVVIF